jgi:G3E family GTPase
VSFGDIEPGALFGPSAIDLRAVPASADLVENASHTDDIHACSLVFEDELDWTAFGIWLTMLLQSRGNDVLRVKGLLTVGGSGPLVLNGVQHVVHPPEHLDEWPDEDHRSRIVFIGRGIDTEALEASLAAFNRAARGGQ